MSTFPCYHIPCCSAPDSPGVQKVQRGWFPGILPLTGRGLTTQISARSSWGHSRASLQGIHAGNLLAPLSPPPSISFFLICPQSSHPCPPFLHSKYQRWSPSLFRDAEVTGPHPRSHGQWKGFPWEVPRTSPSGRSQSLLTKAMTRPGREERVGRRESGGRGSLALHKTLLQ